MLVTGEKGGGHGCRRRKGRDLTETIYRGLGNKGVERMKPNCLESRRWGALWPRPTREGNGEDKLMGIYEGGKEKGQREHRKLV